MVCRRLNGRLFLEVNMAQTISTLTDFINYVNTMYNTSSTPPIAGEEDYLVWTNLANIAINTWENDDLWQELYVQLSAAPNGVKTTTDGVYSYACPTLFKFPACGYVWLGTELSKSPYKVIDITEKQLYEDNADSWCYFIKGASPSLQFNPNCLIPDDQTITYQYYKKASKVSSGTDVFEMSDPMFAVYFVLAELKKDEGNSGELQMAAEKLTRMKDMNEMPSWFQTNQLNNKIGVGFNN